MKLTTFFNKSSVAGLFAVVSLMNYLSAQPNSLQPFIESDTTLNKGTYIVEYNTKVVKGATLTIPYGTKILFKKGVSLKIEGGLVIEGRPNKFVEISSVDIQAEGTGLIIAGANNQKNIEIHYAYFHHLLIPLNFETNWYRRNVEIDNNIFSHIETGEPGIILRHPDEIKYKDSLTVTISKNSFIANNSVIYIENGESDIMKLVFEHNLISGNYYYGFDIGGVLSSPISLLYDQHKKKYTTVFNGNSIFGNYLINNQNDSIIQEINFSIQGKGEKYDISGNYFGNKNEQEIIKTFDHFIINASLPYLNPSPFMEKPSSLPHGHIWKVLLNDKEATAFYIPKIEEETITIRVFPNKLLLARKGGDYVTYHYFDPLINMVVEKLLSPLNTNFNPETNTLEFTFSDKVFVENSPGYFTIGGFFDYQGFPAPKVNIGKNPFIRYLLTVRK